MSTDIASNVMVELARFNLRGPADEARLAETERQVREQYARQSDPYYATPRPLEDSLIEPSASRDVLGLALAARRVLPVTATSVYRNKPCSSRDLSHEYTHLRNPATCRRCARRGLPHAEPPRHP